jgi:hypothetical protein
MFQSRRRAVWALAFGSLLLSSSSALAAPPGQGDMEEEKLETEDPEKAARLHVWADNVFGYGKTPVITTAPIRLGASEKVHSLESVRFSSQNYDLGVSYEFINDLAIGIELPVTHITYDSALESRSVWAVGNVELNAEYVRVIARHVVLVPSLEVALPTAQGEEEPTKAEVDAEPGKARDLTTLDRFSAQRAAAAARGWEENHLFAPHRFGVVPRIGLLFELGKLEIEPYAKMGALFSTRSAPFEGDVVLAIRGAYRIHKLLDAGVRVWTNIPVGGRLPEDESPVGVAEPQVRGHFGAFLPVVGVVLPFAGPLTHPENVGLRIALAAHF